MSPRPRTFLEFLDSTKDKHNGYGGSDFVKHYEKGPGFIRDMFGIGGPSKSRSQADQWIKRYLKEIGKNEDI